MIVATQVKATPTSQTTDAGMKANAQTFTVIPIPSNHRADTRSSPAQIISGIAYQA